MSFASNTMPSGPASLGRLPKNSVGVAVLRTWQLILLSSGGCMFDRGLSVADVESAQRPRASLRVVHVVSESSLLAGLPLGQHRYLTAADEVEPLLVAVVEGFPMVAVGIPSDGQGPDSTNGVPWAILFGRGLQLAPNRIEPDLSLAGGDLVLLGGFALPPGALTPVEYLDVPAVIIEGRLVVPADRGDASSLAWVLVPPGDYRGFIGGPAGSKRADGDISVWGIVVRSQHSYGLWSSSSLLGVARLSPGLDRSGEPVG